MLRFREKKDTRGQGLVESIKIITFSGDWRVHTAVFCQNELHLCLKNVMCVFLTKLRSFRPCPREEQKH